jgi:hypothetical protein
MEKVNVDKYVIMSLIIITYLSTLTFSILLLYNIVVLAARGH